MVKSTGKKVVKTKHQYLQEIYNLYMAEKSKIKNLNRHALYGMFYEVFRLTTATAFDRRIDILQRQDPTMQKEKIIESDVKFWKNEFERDVREYNEEKQTLDINFNLMQISEFYFFKYLDAVHDEIIPQDTTFHTYLRKLTFELPSNIIRDIQYYNILDSKTIRNLQVVLSQKPGLKIPERDSIQFHLYKNSKNVQMCDVVAIKGKFERILKAYSREIFTSSYGSTLKCTANTILETHLWNKRSNKANMNAIFNKANIKSIGISVDMENDVCLSTFIANNKTNVRNKIYVANLMDPGKYMLKGAGSTANTSWAAKAMDKYNEFPESRLNKNQYVLKHLLTRFLYNNQIYMSTQSYTNFKVSGTTPNFDDSCLELKMFNHNNIMLDITPDAKKKLTMTNINKVTPKDFAERVNRAFHGDFQQKTAVISIDKNHFNATGDGAFIGVIFNLDTIMNRRTRIIIDEGLQGGLMSIYGLTIRNSGNVDVRTSENGGPQPSNTNGIHNVTPGGKNKEPASLHRLKSTATSKPPTGTSGKHKMNATSRQAGTSGKNKGEELPRQNSASSGESFYTAPQN